MVQIAPEQLIPSVAGESDGHVATSELGQQKGGDRRRIGQGFVVHRRQSGDDAEGVVLGHVELGVMGPEVGSDALGERRLVHVVLIETDRERMDGLVGLRLHRGDHR
jgi:hypothetical protein